MGLKHKRRRLVIEISAVAILCLVFVGMYFGLQIALGTKTPWVSVASGSMWPALDVGDLVIVQGTYPDSVRVGDIIVFTSLREGYTIHRVTQIQALPNGTLQFKTKGDANPSEDPYWISQQDVCGRVIYRVPYLGWLALDPSILMIVAVAIIVIILVWPEKNQRRRK